MAVLIPDEKWLVLLIKIIFLAGAKRNRLSSGTSNAPYRWWSLIRKPRREVGSTWKAWILIQLLEPFHSRKVNQRGKKNEVLKKASSRRFNTTRWSSFRGKGLLRFPKAKGLVFSQRQKLPNSGDTKKFKLQSWKLLFIYPNFLRKLFDQFQRLQWFVGKPISSE